MAQLPDPFGPRQIPQRVAAQIRSATHLRAVRRRAGRSVAADSTVWPPCARSRSRAVRLMVRSDVVGFVAQLHLAGVQADALSLIGDKRG